MLLDNSKLFQKGIVGYSGTIGSVISKKISFEHKYNSKNIKQIANKKFDLLVCCASPGSMLLANQNPKNDKKNILHLTKHLKKIKTKKLILISTIQVYSNINEISDEGTRKLFNKLPYGRNRRYLEKFCKKQFKDVIIIRLPSIISVNLKKNFIYDIKNPSPNILFRKHYDQIKKKLNTQNLIKFINSYRFKQKKYFLEKKLNKNILKILEDNNLSSVSFTNPDSMFQYYNLDNIIKDINICIKKNIRLINFACEPIKAKVIYQLLKNKKMKSNQGRLYIANIRTKYAKFWKKKNYLYKKKEIMKYIFKISKKM